MDRAILNHFKERDPLLYRAALNVSGIERIRAKPPSERFGELCRKIIGQQLSGKAAESIAKRFFALFPARRPTPRGLETLALEELRRVGLSEAKVRYIKNIAQAAREGSIRVARLGTMSDDEVRRELLAAKGIGPWTVEMFLIFTLGREDVFSSGDLGLRKAFEALYGLTESNARERSEYAERWAPYRSYASRILWRTLDDASPYRAKPTP